jgi:hypothetical protein
MRIVDRVSDTARAISNDEVCWRRLMTGTILAGGLALPSVAAGPATAADLAINISLCTVVGNAGRIIDDGTCPLNNSGTVTNDGTHNGAVDNTGAAAVVVNSATGTWNGDLLSNSGGATVNNFGTWNGDANNASVVINSGIWNTTANGFITPAR